MSIKPTYRSEDGKTHETEEAALRQNELILARSAYNDACDRYNIALAQKKKTADGEFFEVSSTKTYYFVNDFRCSHPILEEIRFSHRYGFRINEQEEIVVTTTDGNHKYYAISDLYVDKKKAIAALVAAHNSYGS
jgi:hypothetical protein